LYILYSISDSFPTPWFANIVNYLVASVFPPLASKAQNDKIKSDAKHYIWDDICGSCAVTRLLVDAFQTMRLTWSYTSIILLHQVPILAYRGQLARCLTVVSIGKFVALVSLVREQATYFHGDNKCLNNLCCFVRCLKSGV